MCGCPILAHQNIRRIIASVSGMPHCLALPHSRPALFGAVFDGVFQRLRKTMNVLIVGCGRKGPNWPVPSPHRVTPDDRRRQCRALRPAWRRLPKRTVQGVILTRRWNADIAHADAFVATTQSDNENIVAAKIARDVCCCAARCGASTTPAGARSTSAWGWLRHVDLGAQSGTSSS